MTDFILVQPESTKTGVAIWADEAVMVVVCGNCKDIAIFSQNEWKCPVCDREHPDVPAGENLVRLDAGEDVIRAYLSGWCGVPEEDIHIAW